MIIYAKTDCEYCLETIKILSESGIHHVLTLLDKAPDFHNKLKQQYEWPTVPIILKVDKSNHKEEFIGGCDDLKKFLKELYGD